MAYPSRMLSSSESARQCRISEKLRLLHESGRSCSQVAVRLIFPVSQGGYLSFVIITLRDILEGKWDCLTKTQLSETNKRSQRRKLFGTYRNQKECTCKLSPLLSLLKSPFQSCADHIKTMLLHKQGNKQSKDPLAPFPLDTQRVKKKIERKKSITGKQKTKLIGNKC